MRLRFLLVFVALAQLAGAGMMDEAVLRDTLAVMGPLMGHRWLEKRGLEDYLFRQSWKPTTDSGLACIGRWSFGPSLKVSLRVTADDTVICLTRGSGASLIRFRSEDSVTLDLLGDVNFAGIPRRAVITDTLVIAGIHSGGTGIEVHGVSDPSRPNLLSRVDLPVVNDIAVNDSLVLAACEDDTLRIYNIADPRNPVRVGACRDSCDLFMTQAGDYCYLVHVSGVNIVDVSDPANPHRVGRLGGGEPLAVFVRDTLAYVTIYQYGLRIYDVSDPATPIPLGSLSGPDALDITMATTCDTVVYTSVLDVISVANLGQPRLLGHADVPADMEYGIVVTPTAGHALVSNYFDGIVAVDLAQPTAPAVDTTAFAATSTEDIWIDADYAYLGSSSAGFSILNVADPSRPLRVGQLDYPGRGGSCLAATACDSFAFICWQDSVPQFRTVAVADRARPALVAGCEVFNPPKDMVLRDSFVYCAEGRGFEVVNVARPREPVLAGSCVTQDGVRFGLAVQDTFAYLMSGALQIINIARPDAPVVVSTNSVGGATGVAVRDTFVYVPYGYDTLRVFSVADPTALRLLGYAPLQTHAWDVALAETTAAVATFNGLELFGLEDPSRPQRLGGASMPYGPRRVIYSAPYYYTAMWEAGVGIYAVESAGVSEDDRMMDGVPAGLSVRPNPVRGSCVLAVKNRNIEQVTVRDVAGRVVMEHAFEPAAGRRQLRLDLSRIRSGVYFVEVDTGGRVASVKLVKQ